MKKCPGTEAAVGMSPVLGVWKCVAWVSLVWPCLTWACRKCDVFSLVQNIYNWCHWKKNANFFPFICCRIILFRIKSARQKNIETVLLTLHETCHFYTSFNLCQFSWYTTCFMKTNRDKKQYQLINFPFRKCWQGLFYFLKSDTIF